MDLRRFLNELFPKRKRAGGNNMSSNSDLYWTERISSALIFPHLDLLSDCGLLAHHAHQLVDHLLAVYPHGRDLPLDLLSLADRLLLEVGGDLTFHLLLRLANNGVLGRGILDQR